MAVDMFLKIEGVKGESVDDSHKGEIDILAWSWGLSQSGTMHMGESGGSGKAAYQDISVTKYVDTASANLMQKCAVGEHYKEAILIVRKAGGKPLEYIKIKMERVMVTSVSTGGSGGEDRLTENVTLNFGKFNYEYVPQKPDGTGGGAIPFGMDIAANKLA